MKIIKVYSVGQFWHDMYPLCPTGYTLQVIIDIRGAIADLLEEIGPIDGTEKVCQDHIMSAPGYAEWLERTNDWLYTNYLKTFLKNKQFECLNIIFVCTGGFQRSVTTAIKSAEYLRIHCAGKAEVVVKHLTMEMTRGLAKEITNKG
ncbi:RNase adapter RapZ [Patescibacteria group bacterium]|nr:RNase adapter RapZ [Patescibacteria group bacterium]